MQFINNTWQKGLGQPFQSFDPATNDVIWEGFEANDQQISEAIQSAQKAFPTWANLTFEKRLSYLQKFKQLLETHRDELAECISKEVGKPKWEALTEVGAMIGKLDISVTAFEDRCQTRETDVRGLRSITRFKPHGLLAVFGPFNFPGHLANGHILPALLAGNVIILKPSELAPLVSEKIFKLWEQVQLPSGVLQLVQGGRHVGRSLSLRSELNGLFFTGSSKVGTFLNENFAKHPEKILALEMGGNNPLVVHNIQDTKAAAYTTIQSAFITAGQRCTCARRLIIVEDQQTEKFLNDLKSLTQNIKVGHYSETPEPFMGPVIHNQSAQNVINTQSQLLENNALSLVKSEILKAGTGLVSPGLIDVTQVQHRSDDECFGPLLQIIRVKDFSSALKEAKNTRYGLSAGLLSDDPQFYEQFKSSIRAGIVNWNHQLTGASGSAPFGGVGLSGNHRPSAYLAADYCSYPVASLEAEYLSLPENLLPGITL